MESLNEEVKFTVFAPNGFFTNHCGIDGWEGVSLSELVNKAAVYDNGNFRPVAWALSSARKSNGTPDDFRAESIAAGRIIEKQADGSFIPRGVGGEKGAAPFRVGGIYRAENGMRYKLYPPTQQGIATFGEGAVLVENTETGCRAGHRDGFSGRQYPGYEDGRNLIPGELSEQGEPIAAHPHEMTLGELMGCASPTAATPPTTEPSRETRENERGGHTVAQWQAIQAAKPEAIDAAKAKADREARKTLGTAGNAHPHWAPQSV